jgi:hypothetical protein
MKNQCHFILIAIFAIILSSCSKSANELVVNQQSAKKDAALPGSGKQAIVPENNIAENTSIYPVINQPLELKLGFPESNLPIDGLAVFYVLLANEFATVPASAATLTLKDVETGDDIQTYSLISYMDAASYGIRVPVELYKKPFMFAIVDLNEQYRDKLVSLNSEITAGTETSVSQLERAFNCNVGIIAERK